MRAWVLESNFGVEHLALLERGRPELGPQEVRVQLGAASLNYRDLLMVRGEYNPRLGLPLIPTSDGAGVVAEVGSQVTRVRVGDAVCPVFARGWARGQLTRNVLTKQTLGGPLDGCLAEELIAPEQELVRAPSHLSAVEAATLPCAALTAWSALVTEGELSPGAAVVVQGSGGVSLFALQFAKALGARVLATTTSAAKIERLRALGADEVVDVHANPLWGRAAREWAGGDGVDHVVDVGGASTLNESLKGVRPGGVVSLIGMLGGSSEKVNLLPILMQNVRVQGVFVGHRESFEAMNRFVEERGLRPVIDSEFAFGDVPRAFERLQSGAQFGKIVVRVGGD
jgi:NADPH:quinone reductase-like Zn-dependent oxidoreductase